MKNKYTTIGIVLTTILLAGVAIFTAIRLYQTKDTAVAPNVPSSKPAAQEANVCSLSFTVGGTPLSCNSDCDPDGNEGQCGQGLLCLNVGTGETGSKCRKPQCSSSASCVCATVTATATATATSTTRATATATSTSQATATATSTSTSNATATATATSNPQCNNSCTSNSNCPSGLMCYIASGATTGGCRNTQCLSETDCTCAVATSTATSVAQAPVSTNQPTLPVVGTSWPTMFATGVGILVIIGSLLLAL
ncbi:MAG: hypothetical protein ACD_19C00016G0033 [uncultured bacterium]|nr:MAG: hypothetical protein ACD_19C00016G0033 [uncultured bacterium]